jgi:hypothetical protein
MDKEWKPQTVEWIIFSIGALIVLIYTIKLLCFILMNCRCKQNLLEKYGTRDKTYAIVTGGSDGIGLALCHELASQGFNICLISRN